MDQAFHVRLPGRLVLQGEVRDARAAQRDRAEQQQSGSQTQSYTTRANDAWVILPQPYSPRDRTVLVEQALRRRAEKPARSIQPTISLPAKK